MGNGNGRKADKKLTKWQPTEKFKAWVDAWLDPEGPMTKKGAAEKVGVSRQTIYDHLKKPEALDYLEMRRQEMFRHYAPIIDTALIAKCQKGDVAAIRLFHELYGDLKHKVEHSGSAINVVIPQELAGVGSHN